MSEKDKEHFERAIGDGDQMKSFLTSGLGKKFKEQLTAAYIDAINGAIDESEHFKEAIYQIHKIANWMNVKLDLAKIAKKQLDPANGQNTEDSSDDEDWG